MKKFLSILCVAVIICGLGCGLSGCKQEKGEFRVGLECAYAPFNWTQQDDSNGAVPIEGGGYIADTPGFSSFETEQMDLVLARDLEYAFPEFAPYLGQCRFTGCAHVKEKGCAVLAAVENGEIAKTRHESYVKLYESVKDLKEWELTKGGTR